MNFDVVDMQIIRALQVDGTLSQNALAERVGASPASCWRRVKALEDAGALRQTVRLADPQLLGLPLNVFCHIRLKNHLPQTTEDLEAMVSLHPEIVECYAMSGDWDYLLRIVCSDVAAYENFLRKKILTASSVANASSAFALSQRKYTTALPI
ncbi:Lrp/AsnC family transcriptional regulator [Sphingobium subterraneum]|uniref:DNA-binding Lrp family transcriptional regulator n=1 Tax=Sphingobium subterraneum TaxID=627688 RepID=A0A841J5E1_9SPHN|nr:Lrp/AsnC family transcriptional regulator [Sphingobium subterraneum]MBB6123441.1 DNA-binding Lrp family transcriptional regulator [Sphingobium subterraneum]